VPPYVFLWAATSINPGRLRKTHFGGGPFKLCLSLAAANGGVHLRGGNVPLSKLTLEGTRDDADFRAERTSEAIRRF
jgi:hypothetical protein